MPNPILGAISQTRMLGAAQSLKSAMALARNSANPNAAIQQMLMTNPQYRQAMDLVNQNGGDVKAAFYSYARQTGMDPEQVLSMLR